MGTAYNSRVVTEGLVLCLDAANPKSYPGTGNTWFDISGNGNHATLYNSPTFSNTYNGSFYLDNIDDYMQIGGLNFETLGSSKNFTFMFGAKKTAFGYDGNNIGNSNLINASFGGYSNGWRITEYYGGTPGQPYNQAQRYGLGIPDGVSEGFFTVVDNVADRFGICAFSVNGSNAYGFLNGNTNTTSTLPTYIDGTNNGNIGSPQGGVGRFCGYISFIQVYNRALSATEIQQNFNATRGRYGI